MITQIDASNLKISLSIKALEEQNEKDALEKYGSKDSGASLGDILGKAISDKKSEE
jgi:small subunit ribosomal protein S1